VSLIELLVLLICTFALALAVTPCIRVFATRRGLIDHPTARSSHTIPTPRGGGLAIVIADFAALTSLQIGGYITMRELIALVAGGGAVALVGFLDDRKSVAASARFLIHLGAAVVVVAMIGGVPIAELFGGGAHVHWIDQLVAVIGIAWSINLFNFMDGIDGIAGAEAVFVSIAAGTLVFLLGGDMGLVGAFGCLAMAAFGFLVWNWPPARIFMGDIGSGFLGFMLAASSILVSHHMPFALQAWPILGGVFLVDASVTLIRRMIRHDKWHQAHRMHAYQHLTRIWRGHLPVTLFVCGVNFCWLLPLAWYAVSHPQLATLCFVIALSPLAVGALWAGAGKP
jgi:Fuc2NAc and GlcNAc transferase